MTKPANFNDLTGQTFARLTVIDRAPNKEGSRSARWNCLCTCGNSVSTRGCELISGRTKSCGCYGQEQRTKSTTKHGASSTKEYSIWRSAKQRCFNPDDKAYKNYGGRGITMHSDWANSFEQFIKDMGQRPSPNLSIERIDNNGDYSPNNCKWGTRDEQNNNHRRNVLLTHNGKTQTIKQWSVELGINYGTLQTRITAYKWSAERALTQPVQVRTKGRQCRIGSQPKTPVC